MKKLLSKNSLILVVLAVSILSPLSALAACNKASNPNIKLYAVSGKQHYATASFSVSTHTNQSGLDNSLKVGCRVRYTRVVDGAKFWYEETYAKATDKSTVSKKQTLSPVIHQLVGADGSWDVTCNYCDVNDRRHSGSISYKSVAN